VDVDRTLVSEAAAGSREAFDELVRRHQGQIFNLTRMLTSGDADAEDLVQETFVRAYRAIARFRGESAFRTWLSRIAINVVRTHLDRRGRRPVTIDTGSDEQDSDLIESLAASDDLETTFGRRRAIDQALAALPDELRTVITLRDIQGLEYHEIATVMNVPMGTVESRVFRARRRLRPMLAPLLNRDASGARAAGAGTPAMLPLRKGSRATGHPVE
jgi:RNA polymerase sigma-70 factor (ECF subfamily)